jgi:hypothetical protein
MKVIIVIEDEAVIKRDPPEVGKSSRNWDYGR